MEGDGKIGDVETRLIDVEKKVDKILLLLGDDLNSAIGFERLHNQFFLLKLLSKVAESLGFRLLWLVAAVGVGVGISQLKGLQDLLKLGN